MAKRKTKRINYVKVRNKKYDKIISICTSVLLTLGVILFLTLPVVKMEIPALGDFKFTGLEAMFGNNDHLKSSMFVTIIFFTLVVCLILNIAGIFNKKFCLFSGLLLAILGLVFIFIKNLVSISDAYSVLQNIKMSNLPMMYIEIFFIYGSSLGLIYITNDENFN